MSCWMSQVVRSFFIGFSGSLRLTFHHGAIGVLEAEDDAGLLGITCEFDGPSHTFLALTLALLLPAARVCGRVSVAFFLRPSPSPLSTDLNAEEAMHISAFRPRSLAHPKAKLPIHLGCFLDAVKVLSAAVQRSVESFPASLHLVYKRFVRQMAPLGWASCV